jgi:hypothetical protein
MIRTVSAAASAFGHSADLFDHHRPLSGLLERLERDAELALLADDLNDVLFVRLLLSRVGDCDVGYVAELERCTALCDIIETLILEEFQLYVERGVRVPRRRIR